MKQILMTLLLLLPLAAGPATAAIGTVDSVPAATLLLPYFEIHPADGPSVNTSFTVGNVLASPTIAHVTLWTDLGVQTLTFDVYLTGYDRKVINLRLLFEGILPPTADPSADPSDRISPQGPLSGENDFPDTSGPCGSLDTPYPRLPTPLLDGLRAAHSGQPSLILGGACGGADHGDDVLRGFVTIDATTGCSLIGPADPGYFTTVAGFENRLVGDTWHIDSANGFADADALVAIEASTSDPLTDGAGDYTFYGRLVGGTGDDHREGLPTTWLAPFTVGGALDTTDLMVWRDAWPQAPFPCASPPADLGQAVIVSYDHESGIVDTYLPPPDDYFPLAAERVDLVVRVPIPWVFGSVYLDLKLGAPVAPFGTLNQSFVIVRLNGLGLLSGSAAAWALDNVATPLATP